MGRGGTLMHEMDGFLMKVAAAEPPLPAGGSVSALVGALAAALGEMVAGLTEGRKAFASVESRVREIHSNLTDLRNTLRALVEKDSSAYKSLLDAKKLPNDPEEKKAARNEAIEKSTRAATEIPLQTARTAYQVLECLRDLAEIGNPHARGDLAAGAQMAYASIKGTRCSVLANIPGLRNASFTESCRTEITDLVRRGRNTLRLIEESTEPSERP